MWRTHFPVILGLGIAIGRVLGDVPRQHRRRAGEWQLPRLGDRDPRRLGRARHLAAAPGRSGRILLDPARAECRVLVRLRTAGLLVLAFPVRLAALGGLLAVVVLASAVAVAALLSVSVAFAALVVTRFTLPAADRLEAGRCHRLSARRVARRSDRPRAGAGPAARRCAMMVP